MSFGVFCEERPETPALTWPETPAHPSSSWCSTCRCPLRSQAGYSPETPDQHGDSGLPGSGDSGPARRFRPAGPGDSVSPGSPSLPADSPGSPGDSGPCMAGDSGLSSANDQDYFAETLSGARPEVGRRLQSLRPQAGDSGPQRPETPGLVALTASFFVGGYKYPPPTSPPTSSSSIQGIEVNHYLSSPNLRFLPILPPKCVDLWRIEGEGPDLHLHQAVLHFPLIHLRDFLPRVSLCRKPRHH